MAPLKDAIKEQGNYTLYPFFQNNYTSCPYFILFNNMPFLKKKNSLYLPIVNRLYTMVNNLFIIINYFYVIVSNLYIIINKLFIKKNIFVNNFKNKYEKRKPKIGYFVESPIFHVV